MVRGKDERADFEWIEALRATERADDDLVEQRPRPQEKSAVDRAAGHLVQGSPIGRESDLPGHFGCRAYQEPCKAKRARTIRQNPGDLARLGPAVEDPGSYSTPQKILRGDRVILAQAAGKR